MNEKAGDQRFYDVIRSRIEHEDGLIVQRLSWFMGAQSFLFTAYAIALNGPPAARRVLTLMPWIGVLFATLIFGGILAALGAMAWLRRSYAARGVTEESLGLPPVFTPAPIRRLGLAAPIVLPLIVIAAWAWLLWNTPA